MKYCSTGLHTTLGALRGCTQVLLNVAVHHISEQGILKSLQITGLGCEIYGCKVQGSGSNTYEMVSKPLISSSVTAIMLPKIIAI